VVTANSIVARDKDATQQRLHSQHRKYIGSYMQSHNLLRLIDTGEIGSPSFGSSHVLKDMVLALPVKEVRGRSRGEAVLPDDDELFRLDVGKRAQENGIDHAEDRSVRSDAEGEGEESNCGKAGGFG